MPKQLKLERGFCSGPQNPLKLCKNLLCSYRRRSPPPAMSRAPFSVNMKTNHRCLSSSALSGDDDGLAICSAALRNLSTATSPRALTSERAAACFGATKRLLSCCDQPQVKVDCAAAIVNFVDATQVQDLQVGGDCGVGSCTPIRRGFPREENVFCDML